MHWRYATILMLKNILPYCTLVVCWLTSSTINGSTRSSSCFGFAHKTLTESDLTDIGPVPTYLTICSTWPVCYTFKLPSLLYIYSMHMWNFSHELISGKLSAIPWISKLYISCSKQYFLKSQKSIYVSNLLSSRNMEVMPKTHFF